MASIRLTKRPGAVFAGIAAVVICAGGYTAWRSQHSAYEGPPRTEEGAGELIRNSTLVLPVALYLDDLEKSLNDQVPSTLYAINEGRDSCVPAKWIDECIIPRLSGGCIQRLKTKITPEIDCHVDGKATRGPITLGGSGGTLTITMPVRAAVTVTGRGAIGKHIRETVDGAITATASAKVAIDESWQPSADVKADYAWNDRLGVDVLGFRITFASQVDPKIREAIESFKAKIPELLAKLDVKGQAEKAWSRGFANVHVASGPDIWVSFAPNAIGFGGYQVDDRTLRFAIMAGGETKTFVGKKPSDQTATPLPSLQRELGEPGFNFVAPVFGYYAALEGLAETALKVGKSQPFNVPGMGNVEVTFKKVTIHQTSGRGLAIGVTLDADTLGSLWDTTGTVWLTTHVVLDSVAMRVSLDKLEVYSQTNNQPLDLLTAVLQIPTVNSALRNAIQYDFSSQYHQLLKQANDALTRQISDEFYISGQVNTLTAEEVTAAPDALIAILSAKGNIEVRSGKLTK